MRATPSIVAHEGYRVTAKGIWDLEHADLCRCTPRVVGLLVECSACGTVYGHLRDSVDRSPLPHEKRRGA